MIRNKPSFVLFISNYCTRRLYCCEMRSMRAFAWFYCLLRTLRIVRTLQSCRYCFYHESKMGMTPQLLVCTLKGSSCRPCTATKSLLLYEYDIHCSLFLLNMLLRQMKGSKHLYIPERTAVLVLAVFLAQSCCFVWLISHLMSRHLFHSGVNLTVLFLCSSL